MYYKRDLEEKIERYLDAPEIIAIFGPRQVGKTTLMKALSGRVSNPVFLSFEDIELKMLFEEDLKSFIALYVDPYDHIFIDEFQYARNGGKQLKYIYDTTGKKIFISGSSAIELSVNTVRYLAGRIFLFHLHSFSFGEFLRARDEALFRLYELADETISDPMCKRFYVHFDEYIRYGGYPRVVLSDSVEEKEEVLKNLLSVYLLRDVKEIAKIADESKMYRLLKALSIQVGNLVVYNELARLIGVSSVKLKEYLDILEKAFLTKMLPPFYTNKQLEIVKNPKIFFFDLGLRNVLLKNFSSVEDRADGGALLENFVFRELVERELKYYRTKNGAEVDFIVDDSTPVEVKSHLGGLKLSKSYHHFIQHYRPSTGYVLNFDQRGIRHVGETTIRFLPHFLAKKIERRTSIH